MVFKTQITFEGKDIAMTLRLILIIFFLLLNFQYSQQKNETVINRAVDLNGEFIPFASVYSDDEKSVLITTSDKEGKFIISKDKLKNSFVVISHSNFKDLKVSYENLNLNKTIKLDKKIYYFDPIFVIGNKYNFESNNLPVKHIIINSVDFPSHGNSLGEKLDRFGLNIKDYGGTSGLKTIASQTGFSEHVLVMVDGFEINSPQNGVVDLSNFPGDLFSHAEYYNGQGSSIYGSNAIGGVINLIPSSKSNFIKLKNGSMGEQGISFNGNIYNQNSNFSLFVNNYKNENDFRENNQFEQISSSLNFNFNFDNWDISSNLIYLDTDRRIPGSLTYPSLNAFKKNEDILLTLNASTVSNFGYTSISAGNHSTNENYVDPDWLTDSNHEVQTNRLKFNHRFKFQEKTQNLFILDFANMTIKSDDTGNHTMNTIGSTYLLNYNFFKNLKISPSIRFDWDDHSKNSSTTSNLALILKTNSFFQKFTFNAGTSFRKPTFNDLFWLDSGFSKGNPNLQPEQGSSFETEISIKSFLNKQLSFSLNSSFFRTSNLIQWSPDQNFVYSPQNILDSESLNFGVTSKIKLNDLPLEITSGITLNNSEVLSEGDNKGMELLYVPASSSWSEVKFKYNNFSSLISYRNMQNKRYSYYGENSIIKNYERVDFSISVNLNILSKTVNLDIGARNLLDKKNIQSVYDYSEPGRSIFINTLINF